MKIDFYTGGRLNSLQAHPMARAVETAAARARGPATAKFALSRAGLVRGIQTLTAEMPQICESFTDLKQSDERYVTVGDARPY